MFDGLIRIGTEVNKDGFNKGINDLQKEKVKSKKIDIEIADDYTPGHLINDIAEADKQLNEMKNKKILSDEELRKFEFLEQFISKANDRLVQLTGSSVDLDATQFAKANAELQQMVEKYYALERQKIVSEDDLQKIEQLKQDILELVRQMEKMSGQRINIKGITDVETSTQNINNNLSGIGNGISGIIKKCAKWALAVFGIRSAYRFVRQAVSTLSQYNEQIANDIEYIRFALASALQPVIEFIIRLAYKLLSIIGSILYTLSKGKINIFKNAGVDKFNSKLSTTNKKVKELKKQLAGFDEMNVLEDNKTDSDSGDDYKTPSMDLSKLNGKLKKIDWMDWIKNNWKTVLKGILLVLGGLLLFQGLKWLFTGSGSKAVVTFFKSFGTALQIIAILGGLALVIHEISGLITAFSESGLSLKEVLGLLVTVLGTVTVAFTLMALATKLFNLAGIAGAIVILGGLALIIHEIAGLLKVVSKSGMDVGDVIDILIGLVGSITVLVLALTVAILALSSPMALVGALALVGAIAGILFTIKATLPTILDAVGKFTKTVAPPLIAVMNTIGDILDKIIRALGDTLPPIIKAVGKVFDTIFKGINSVIKTVANSIIKILDKIIWFVNSLGPGIESLVNSIINAVTRLINFIISALEFMVNSVVINGINGMIGAINKLGSKVGIHINEKAYVSFPRFVPRLAKGGIVNMPGRGTPVGMGSAIAGERGQEGVIPLTDSQQMDLLGQAIGKYISLNATIPVYVGNRLVAREMKKINTESDFAYNR